MAGITTVPTATPVTGVTGPINFTGPSYHQDLLICLSLQELLVNENHYEFGVERAVGAIMDFYFPHNAGWYKVPQYYVPERKFPDRVIERLLVDPATGRPYTNPINGRPKFVPHLFAEFKRGLGDSNAHALRQLTSSMTESLEDKVESFAITVRGLEIGFFEFTNDGEGLRNEELWNFNRAVPWNLIPDNGERPYFARPNAVNNFGGRPCTRSELKVKRDRNGTVQSGEISGIYLHLIDNAPQVDAVFKYMAQRTACPTQLETP